LSVFTGDIGVQFKLNAGIDISANTRLEIHYIKPDLSTGCWSAILFGTNYAVYTTVAGDLDQAGMWTLQIYVETPSYKAHGKKAQVLVDKSIPTTC
jgi:hypothetical protein